MRIMRVFHVRARPLIACTVAATCFIIVSFQLVQNSRSLIGGEDQSENAAANQKQEKLILNANVRRGFKQWSETPSSGATGEKSGQNKPSNRVAELNRKAQQKLKQQQPASDPVSGERQIPLPPKAILEQPLLNQPNVVSGKRQGQIAPVQDKVPPFQAQITHRKRPGGKVPSFNDIPRPGANSGAIGQRQRSGSHGERRSPEEPSSVDQQGALLGAKGSVRPGYPKLIDGQFIAPQRIVHFDLKGAAPKVDYFRHVFALISRKLGATGVLLEWEDMFPYTGRLAKTNNGYHYSEQDIQTILGWAKEFKLEVIPLVQTFGHLEWILKHPEFNLREVQRYPQVLCLSNPGSLELVKEMIDQVMRFHTDIRYFHIGADEAFQVGQCPVCQKNIRENLNGSREILMLKHISSVAGYLRDKYQKKALMWHDMLQNIDGELMNHFELGKLVEPVVWAYAENLDQYLSWMWDRFAAVFPNIWGASAFKGADGPTRWWSNVPHYLKNHQSWVRQMTSFHHLFTEFRGVFLTGWQSFNFRFDHFAVLCEVFPVGIPSLAINLLTLKTGRYDRNTLQQAATALQCRQQYLEIDRDGAAASCDFPGARVYDYVQQLKTTKEQMETKLLDDYQLRGWLSRFAMRHNYSSAWYLDQVIGKLLPYKNDYDTLAQNLRNSLAQVFFPDCVDEFIFTYVQEDLDKLRTLVDNARRLGGITHFPGRPFPILLNDPQSMTTTGQVLVPGSGSVLTRGNGSAIQLHGQGQSNRRQRLI